MKVWELHNVGLDGAIRTTPDGEAEILGLVLSEKAYLLAVREFRPVQLVELVRRNGPANAATRLVAQFDALEALQTNAGRCLVAARSASGGPGIYRSDEVVAGQPVGRGL